MGLETLAVSLGEDSGTVEDMIEPYLYCKASLIARKEAESQQKVHTDI